jgi:hypothetical protein
MLMDYKYQSVKDQSLKGIINVTTPQTRWLQGRNMNISINQQYCRDLGTLIHQLHLLRHAFYEYSSSMCFMT